MIAKTTTGSSFDSALGYGAADLTENQRQHKQAQVVLLDCYNLISSEWRGMAAEMSAVAQGSRCQTPVWHTSLSVGAGESLSGEQWRAAARQYCVSMGADPQQHQVAVFQHHDTANPHVHIYINRVRLDDGPALHTGHNFARNVKATRHIEQNLALAPLPNQRTSLKDHSPAIQANRQQLATLVGQVLSQTKPGTFAELAADLAGQGVQMKVVTNAKGGYGVSFKAGDNPPAKGSAIGYKYRHLQHQLDANRAEYQAEIERLKKALEEAENKPAEMVEVEKVVEIIKQVEVTKEVEVIKEVTKRDPADVAEIDRLKTLETELRGISDHNYSAWEQEKARADVAENKPAKTVTKEVEVIKEVVRPDPADLAEIVRLKEQEGVLIGKVLTNYKAWEREKARADEAENRPARTITKEVTKEVEKVVIRRDPDDVAEIDRLKKRETDLIDQSKAIITNNQAIVDSYKKALDEVMKQVKSAATTATVPSVAQTVSTAAVPPQPTATERWTASFKAKFKVDPTPRQINDLITKKPVQIPEIGLTVWVAERKWCSKPIGPVVTAPAVASTLDTAPTPQTTLTPKPLNSPLSTLTEDQQKKWNNKLVEVADGNGSKTKRTADLDYADVLVIKQTSGPPLRVALTDKGKRSALFSPTEQAHIAYSQNHWGTLGKVRPNLASPAEIQTARSTHSVKVIPSTQPQPDPVKKQEIKQTPTIRKGPRR